MERVAADRLNRIFKDFVAIFLGTFWAVECNEISDSACQSGEEKALFPFEKWRFNTVDF